MMCSSHAIEKLLKQHRQDRDALAHRGLEIHAGEADGGVAPDIDAELVGMRRASRPWRGRGHSPAAWSCPSRYRCAARASTQNGESWSRGLPASWVMMVLATSTVCMQVPDHAIGRQRRLVGGELRHPLGEPRLAHRGDLARRPRRCRAAPAPARPAPRAAHRASAPASPTRPSAAGTSLLRWSGSSVAWIIVLPLGMAMAKEVSVKLQPMPKITSAWSRKWRTVLGMADAARAERQRCVLGEGALAFEARAAPARRAARRAARSCGQARAQCTPWPA